LAGYTYLAANLPTGITAVQCTDATCSDAKVFFKPASDVCEVELTWADAGGGGVAGTDTEGNNGRMLVPVAQNGRPGIAWIGDENSGVGSYPGLVDTSGLFAGATTIPAFYCNASGGCFSSGAILLETYARIGSTAGYTKIEPGGSAKGQIMTVTSAVANCTFVGGGGAATCVTSAFIPLGASVVQVTGRQVTASTTCTTCTAGADMGPGLDADQYGAALECDVDNTPYTAATATASVMGTCMLAGGCTITMTAVGGNCVSGVTAWTVHYITASGATSD
jgi:hypothetical protein